MMMSFQPDAVGMLGGIRTPHGLPQGYWRATRPDTLLAEVLAYLPERYPILAEVLRTTPEKVQVLAGCANQSGEDCRNVARQAALLAQYPYAVHATTLNKLCGSGMDAIHHGMALIQSGMAEVVIACGVESASRAPYVMARDTPESQVDSRIGWRFTHPAFEIAQPLEADTANVAVAPLAQEMPYVIDVYCQNQVRQGHTFHQTLLHRHTQETWVYHSHQKAVASYPQRCAILYDLAHKNAAPRMDECSRPHLTLKALARLKPYPTTESHLTPATMMGVYDGAAAVVLVSKTLYDTWHTRRVHQDSTHHLHTVWLTQASQSAGHPLKLHQALHWAWKSMQAKLPTHKQTLSSWLNPSNHALSSRSLIVGESFVASIFYLLLQEGILHPHNVPLECDAVSLEAQQAQWLAYWQTLSINPLGGTLALGGPMGSYGITLCLEAWLTLCHNPTASYEEALILLGVGMGQASALLVQRELDLIN
ncbi:MAG: hypothetical protein ACKO37_08505 [Vampirovibrionales bacterium]